MSTRAAGVGAWRVGAASWPDDAPLHDSSAGERAPVAPRRDAPQPDGRRGGVLRRLVAERRLAQPLVAALLMAASFPPLGLWPLALLAPAVLVHYLASEPSWRRRWLGASLGGALFAALGLAWLRAITTPGWVFLAVHAGGLSWLLFAAIAGPALRHPRGYVPLAVVPAAWVVSEAMRGVLPANLPWLYLAHAAAGWPPLVQGASIAGAWAISFPTLLLATALVRGHRSVMLGAALAIALPALLASSMSTTVPAPSRASLGGDAPSGARAAPAGPTSAPLAHALAASAGAPRPREHDDLLLGDGRGAVSRATLTVGIVQPALSPADKSDAAKKDAVLERLRVLSREVAADADVVLWPESAYPKTLGQRPKDLLVLSDLVRELGRPLVAGSVTIGRALYNSLVVLDATGTVTAVYDKRRLVMISEYLPGWMRGTWLETAVTGTTRLPHRFDFTPGTRPVVFDVAGVPVTGAICYEHSSWQHVREGILAGGRLLLHLGNEGAFDGTAELAQAQQIATLRAVEHRVPIVRVMNSGISGVIDASGRATTLPPGERAALLEVTPGDGHPSFYTRHGDWLAWLSAAMVLAFGVARLLAASRPPFVRSDHDRPGV